MEYEAFKALEGQDIGIASPAGELRATVESVTRLGEPRDETSRLPYSVLLKAPREPLLDQGIHRMTIGDQVLELFMVPIGPEREQMCYEVIFN